MTEDTHKFVAHPTQGGQAHPLTLLRVAAAKGGAGSENPLYKTPEFHPPRRRRDRNDVQLSRCATIWPMDSPSAQRVREMHTTLNPALCCAESVTVPSFYHPSPCRRHARAAWLLAEGSRGGAENNRGTAMCRADGGRAHILANIPRSVHVEPLKDAAEVERAASIRSAVPTLARDPRSREPCTVSSVAFRSTAHAPARAAWCPNSANDDGAT
jgi:hypothetical protein